LTGVAAIIAGVVLAVVVEVARAVVRAEWDESGWGDEW
jgi:hypothetical protein